MATIWYMWPTKDGKGWIVATRIKGDMNAVLREGAGMGLPKPVAVGGVPPGWEGVSDRSK